MVRYTNEEAQRICVAVEHYRELHPEKQKMNWKFVRSELGLYFANATAEQLLSCYRATVKRNAEEKAADTEIVVDLPPERDTATFDTSDASAAPRSENGAASVLVVGNMALTRDPMGKPYYFDTVTKETHWELPSDLADRPARRAASKKSARSSKVPRGRKIVSSSSDEDTDAEPITKAQRPHQSASASASASAPSPAPAQGLRSEPDDVPVALDLDGMAADGPALVTSLHSCLIDQGFNSADLRILSEAGIDTPRMLTSITSISSVLHDPRLPRAKLDVLTQVRETFLRKRLLHGAPDEVDRVLKKARGELG